MVQTQIREITTRMRLGVEAISRLFYQGQTMLSSFVSLVILSFSTNLTWPN